jgi:hypothetical protein
VKWEDVFRPKNQGGLGDNDLRFMNISLLTKWRWRLLSEREPFWKGIIQAKYGRGRDLGEWAFRETPRVSDSIWWKGPIWRWDFKWRRNFFVWEEELVINLDNLLNQVHLSTMDDEWKCHHPTGGTFTVNSIYSFLSNSISPPPVALVVEKLLLLEYLWKSYVPYKVIVFTCQLLLGRLPTKGNLFKRRIFYETQQRDCLWCP